MIEGSNLTPETDQALYGYEQTPLSPEDGVRMQVGALLGAYNDVHANDELTQAQKNERDEIIFSGLKQTVDKAESLQNISLLGEIQERIKLQEAFCGENHDNNFSEKVDEHGVLESKKQNQQADEEDEKKGKKGKKRRRIRRGWLSYLSS